MLHSQFLRLVSLLGLGLFRGSLRKSLSNFVHTNAKHIPVRRWFYLEFVKSGHAIKGGPSLFTMYQGSLGNGFIVP